MLGGIQIALTGMQATSRMVGVSAHNIANIPTEGFKRMRAIPEEQGAGGVRITVEQDPTTGPTHFLSSEDGAAIGEGANVDLTEELTHTLQATQLFKANVASLGAQDKTLGTLLDIIE